MLFLPKLVRLLSILLHISKLYIIQIDEASLHHTEKVNYIILIDNVTLHHTDR